MAEPIDDGSEEEFSSVFTDIFPAEWAADPDFCQYLTQLSGYSLQNLKKEPQRLREAREENLSQTQNLAFENYKTFIQTADCSRDVFSEFGNVESKLDSLLDELPSAIDNCNEFHEKATGIAAERKMNNLTRSRYTELLELLEISQLMDTTVRNGYYDEALELIEFARKLEKKFASIKVIKGIVDAVKQSSHLLLNHLLAQLRTNIQLPTCLRIIGYLRRMNCFSEAELRIKFLESRDDWLQQNLNQIPKSEPHQHIMKTIEACRVHMFDIITQYRAIFSDEDNLSGETSESILFHSWVVKKIEEFLTILETDLSHQSCSGHMESILAQSMYFGLSFSRVGADFRPQLAPIFLKAIQNCFDRQLDRTEAEFLHNMKMFHLNDSISLFSTPIASAIGVSLQPPPSLLEFPPFAMLANGMQAGFSSLRSCCPLALGPSVRKRLTQTTDLIISEITKLHRNEAASFTAREKDSYIKLCSTIVNEMLPFVNNCLSHLFPQAALAETLGMTLRESHQICQLDLVTLTEPLQAYIPKEEDIQIPLKKFEANSEANTEPNSEPNSEVPEHPVTPETIPSENPGESDEKPDEKPVETVTETIPEPVETNVENDTSEPTTDSVSDTPEVALAEPPSESVQSPSETAESSSDQVETTETTVEETKTEDQPGTESKETKHD